MLDHIYLLALMTTQAQIPHVFKLIVQNLTRSSDLINRLDAMTNLETLEPMLHSKSKSPYKILLTWLHSLHHALWCQLHCTHSWLPLPLHKAPTANSNKALNGMVDHMHHTKLFCHKQESSNSKVHINDHIKNRFSVISQMHKIDCLQFLD